MIRFKKDIRLIGILILFAVCFIYPQTSLANAPSEVKLSYDFQSQMLTVTIAHSSTFPKMHYIKSVEIKKGGNVVSNNKYETQPDQAIYTYRYKVPAAEGDTLEATVNCNLYGAKTANLTLGK